MTTQNSANGESSRRISLDTWSVLAALLLVLVVKLNLLGKVPW